MSHFSVCVIVPHDKLENTVGRGLEEALCGILAPYDEGTEEPAYLTFHDKTEEMRCEYENEKVTAVRFADGALHHPYDPAFSKRFMIRDGQVVERDPKNPSKYTVTDECRRFTLVPNYPRKDLCSFEEYCEDEGYRKCGDRWGYYSNPDAKWDWWTVGGRFSKQLLVGNDVTDYYVAAKKVGEAPEGFKFADAAQMQDIAWDTMKNAKIASVEKEYDRLSKAFETQDVSALGPIARWTEDGIISWGETIYEKGETLENFKNRRGVLEEDRYAIQPYALVDREGDWHGSGDMGWFAISMNDKPKRDWNDEIQACMSRAEPEDVIIIVDCHI